MRISGSMFAALLAVTVIGCRVVSDTAPGSVATNPPAQNSDSPERAAEMAAPPTITGNSFVGKWSSDHGGTVHYNVEFFANGTVTFAGGGINAAGKYITEGRLARIEWQATGANTPGTEFVIGENGVRMSFQARRNADRFEELTRQ